MAVSERQSGQRLVGMRKRYGGALTVMRGSVSGGFYVFRGKGQALMGKRRS
jgi:hypothetical protein